jgi:hypothetical protein
MKLSWSRTKRAETASEAYKRNRAKVEQLVGDLQRMLGGHAKLQQGDPSNWGYAGDMAHYAELLEELLGRRG